MEINNISQMNQEYLNKQKNSTAEQEKEYIPKKDNGKKLVAALVSLGIVAAGTILVVNKLRKGKAANIKLSDIEFKNNELGALAYTKEGDFFTGEINDTLKNGDKIKLSYKSGKLKKSERIGERNFTKVYENDFPKNSVHITENGNTKTIDLIKTKSDVNYDQDRLEHLFKNEKYYSSDDFKKEANEIKFKSKKQQEKLDEILKNKKIQEETEKQHNVLPKITENEAVPKVAENMSDATNFEIIDMSNAGVNIAEYQKSKHVIIEQIKKQKKKFDDKDIELVHKYKNCTYEDLEKVLHDDNSDELGKFWLCAKGNLEKKGSAVLIDEVPDIFKGIPENTLTESIDNLVLSGIGDGYYKIGNKTFKIENIGAGTYSSVFKISDGANKPVVLKYAISANDNAYCNEILLAKHLKNAGVVDIPKLYMANPITQNWMNIETGYSQTRNAWQILDCISEGQKVPEGKKLFDYLKEINAKHYDFNQGTLVGDYIVDLGGIRGNNITKPYSSFVCNIAPQLTNNVTLDELYNVIS